MWRMQHAVARLSTPVPGDFLPPSHSPAQSLPSQCVKFFLHTGMATRQQCFPVSPRPWKLVVAACLEVGRFFCVCCCCGARLSAPEGGSSVGKPPPSPPEEVIDELVLKEGKKKLRISPAADGMMA